MNKSIFLIVAAIILPALASASNDSINIESLKGDGYTLEYIDPSDIPSAKRSTDVEKGSTDVEKSSVNQSKAEKSGRQQSNKKRNSNKVKQQKKSKNEVVKENTQSGNNAKKEKGNKLKNIFIGILCVIGLYVIYKIYRYRRCPNCNRWNQLRLIREEIVDTMATSLTEERKMKNRKGEVVRTYEVDVPATKYEILKTYKCKRCGHIVRYTCYKTEKN